MLKWCAEGTEDITNWKGYEMENYITVSFWMFVVSVCSRGFTMVFGAYPIKTEKTLGQEVFGAMLNIGFAIWAGILIF